MRVVAHLVSLLLIAPQLLLFGVITLVEQVTKTRTFFGLLDNALNVLHLLFGWGGAGVVVALLLLVGLGFSTRWRFIASSCVLALDVGTGIYVAVVGAPFFFLVPGLIAALLCVWVIRKDYANDRRFPAAHRDSGARDGALGADLSARPDDARGLDPL